MITLQYGYASSIQDRLVDAYLDLLPQFMQQEIGRYRFVDDRKSRLLARLMLRQSLEAAGVPELLHQFSRDEHNKPGIKGWCEFNISHSGDLVLFASCDQAIGIDTEEQTNLNISEILPSFHRDEQAFVLQAPDRKKAFFEIWTKKEAFLKAVGVGIVQGLQEFCCLGNCVVYHGNWYFHSVSINPAYTVFICSSNPAPPIHTHAFTLPKVQPMLGYGLAS